VIGPLVALVVAAAAPIPASAQSRAVRVGGATITATDTLCWETSQVPCVGVGRVELAVVTGRLAIAIRVTRVEVRTSTGWREADDLLVSLRSDGSRVPPRPPPAAVRVPARGRDQVFVHHARVRATDPAQVRITLEIRGRSYTIAAEHRVITESPDPEF